MTYTTLITTLELQEHLSDTQWAIFDCRFSLADVEYGKRNYLEAHIPGAVYAHLDHHLSSPVIPGVTGRHPWPSVEQAAETFANFGIEPGVQVVAYDDAGGALAAVRLWWMLRWLGHAAVCVLDGGWQRWISEGRPVASGTESRSRRNFQAQPRLELLLTSSDVERLRNDPKYRLLDARARERYHGQNETLDPVAGHIPGAISAPYMDNLSSEGTFRPTEELHAHYRELLGDIPAERTVVYCGSGVTSIHNLLAMMYAGVGEGRLYAGSWSEWITNPQRPIAV